MLEKWNAIPIHEKYYDAHQPIECTHSYDTGNDIIYIFTMLFGIVDGLTTVLNIVIVPQIMKTM